MMAFDLGDYVDVAERLTVLRDLYPEARLRPLDPTVPYRIETIGTQTFVVYAAACYLTPDDPNPGVGIAWEPVPGTTPYTKNSELQNAETSAWGRAIVAALVADTKRGVASRQEVRNRRDEPAAMPYDFDPDLVDEVKTTVATLTDEERETFTAWKEGQTFVWPWPVEACTEMLRELARILQGRSEPSQLPADMCPVCRAEITVENPRSDAGCASCDAF